jgi:phage shock protein PspC (stress-responsive transcriptional regulator)
MVAFARQGLIRPRHGRVVAGVCAGLAVRLGLGPWVTRILFLLANLLIPGSFLIVYVVLWVLMPDEIEDWRQPAEAYHPGA